MRKGDFEQNSRAKCDVCVRRDLKFIARSAQRLLFSRSRKEWGQREI